MKAHKEGICPTPASGARGRTKPFAAFRRITVFALAVIIAASCFVTVSALSATQAFENLLSSMITAVYTERTDFTATQINAEIRRTVRAVERAGMIDNVFIENGFMVFDWLTLFLITDWFFTEMVIEVSYKHDDNGYYINSERGYGYTFIGNGFIVDFPRINEMCLIIAAIDNNIVDWNPLIIADSRGITEIGGLSVADIKRLLSWSGEEPPDYPELTDRELNEALLNRLDIIAGILIMAAGIAAAAIFCLIIYNVLIRFT
jgi:hypothetical protein